MNRTHYFMLVLVMTTASEGVLADSNAAGNEECSAVLVKKDLTANSSRSVRYAWLKLVNSHNYDEAKHSASASYVGYGMFDGSYDDFSMKRSDLFQKESVHFSDAETTELVISGLTDTEVAEWGRCVREKMAAGSLAVWPSSISQTGAVLYVRWKPGNGTPALENGTVTLMDGRQAGTNATVVKLNRLTGEETIAVERISPNKAVTGVINGDIGAGGHVAFDVVIPVLEPAAPLPPEIKQEKVDVGRYGSATLTLGPYSGRATAQVVVSNSAVWTQSGDPQFGFTVSTSDGSVSKTLGPFGLVENQGARTEQSKFSLEIPASASVDVVSTTTNHHADAVDLRIDARVTITH